jgi:hypothetical protein
VDVKALIGEVAARNGIRLEPGDPAFALVTLNQLVLEEAVRDLVAEIRAATADFEAAAERVQGLAGATLAREINQLAVRGRQGGPTDSGAPAWCFALRWMCTGAIIALGLMFAGTLFGHFVWRSP